MDYQKRLENLNQSKTKNVLDCIDRPIRPLIIELNRIGLRTKFSCCGFPYQDEEEPKTHAKHPFIVLIDPCKDADKYQLGRVGAFFALCRLTVGTGWILHPYTGNGEWYLNGKNLVQGENEFYRHESSERGVHDYETSLIAIQALTKRLKSVPDLAESFVIIDGNSDYAVLTDGEWQIEPKPPVEFQTEKGKARKEENNEEL